MKFTNLVNPELDIDFKKEKYVELKDDNEKFKYVLLLVCKKLGNVIPQVFDRTYGIITGNDRLYRHSNPRLFIE